MTTLLPITLCVAAAAALLSVWLGLRASRLRIRHSIAMGDGGHDVLLARMRAQANFVEYAPVFVLLLLAVELAIGSPAWLWALAALFLLGRVAHPFGMERPAPNALRVAGTLITWTALIGLALAALWIALGR